MLADDPPVIVVRGQHGVNEATVVGAVFKQGATIVRGKKRIGLDHIHAGDKVTLKYVKTRDGLTVRSIVLHRNWAMINDHFRTCYSQGGREIL